MATDVTPNLMRSIQRGSVRTKGLPTGLPPAGVFTEDEGPADGQMATMVNAGVAEASDDDFAALFGGIPSAGDAASDEKPALEVAASLAEPPVSPVPPASRNKQASRAERFGQVASQVAGAPQSVKEVDAALAGVQPGAPVRRLIMFFATNDKREAIAARQAMAAAKVLTPLVAAVSFAPGSQSLGQSKTKALTEMLVGVHRCAVTTAETISEHMGKDVPSWMVTQLMQSLAAVVAKRWESGQGVDVDALATEMRSLFGQFGPEIDALVRGASEDAYVEVTHPDIARFRVSVSAVNAAWLLYDWVTHPRLSLDESGDMPSRFFTFNQTASSIVNKMLVRCVNECRGLVAQVESADLRTAHMQNSIARMANLIGSEYVTRTRHVMNWIGDPAITDAEYQARLDAAVNELDSRLLPEIYEHARVSFLSIEQGAFRTIEELHEKTTSEPVSGDSNSRPST